MIAVSPERADEGFLMNDEGYSRCAAVLGSWFLVLGCERSLRDVIVLIVTIRGLKPTERVHS